MQRGGRGRGAVKEILTCLNQHRKQPLTQIQPQVASTFSLLLFSSVSGTLCGPSSSCCDMHYLCRICPTTERQPCGRKLTIWHHDKRALATMMHACQSPDRLPTPTPTPDSNSVPASATVTVWHSLSPVSAAALSHFSAWLATCLAALAVCYSLVSCSIAGDWAG